MGNRKQIAIVGVLTLTLVAVAGTGCVTKKTFRRNVETTDTRVSGVEDAVEANERRLGDLRSETDEKIAATRSTAERALSTGEQARSAAEQAAMTAEQAKLGRLLWEIKLSDDDVKFATGRAMLTDNAKGDLDGLVGEIKGYGKAVYLEIEGHTDATGPETLNERLGEQRAQVVREYLAKAGGIPLHAMEVISYGESQPVADNKTRDGRAQNRRVVIKVLE